MQRSRLERGRVFRVEAPEGIDQLAKAGVSTQAILSGGLNGALDLAAAATLCV